ncbi:uncharacterized protein PGTG_05259 [Puccinia graminis f. sp. tritici CRL 75-36-700-3]|uniref:Uncharacterized protein n=1 Tax=Puccinia graminis f. sp. tritici (strain CRL 75-36-700-3 / race SCCL) TaxID=418459 RepID=E3K6N8_PUCGT|nr:uncharacterized protein PGTG_05259 [Puccinia graminis f. sp. tritici CRL 75-36-700-3]EFP80034.2 hypothetical protein PGTG_05259 [Puccinia graminis f. sp. tritici CRL 75-36-700-3]
MCCDWAHAHRLDPNLYLFTAPNSTHNNTISTSLPHPNQPTTTSDDIFLNGLLVARAGYQDCNRLNGASGIETRCVIKDPETYKARSRPASLSRDECLFMVCLVQSEPGLFLDEIQERLYDSSGVFLSVEGVHRNLVEQLSITLKKPETKNCWKSLVEKYSFVEKMEFFPADFLVFTDESSFCDKDLL